MTESGPKSGSGPFNLGSLPKRPKEVPLCPLPCCQPVEDYPSGFPVSWGALVLLHQERQNAGHLGTYLHVP